MPDVGNYFAWLGLAPGAYSPQELANRLDEFRRFERDESRLADATLAFCLLRDPDRQHELFRSLTAPTADSVRDEPAAPLTDPDRVGRAIAAAGVAGPADSEQDAPRSPSERPGQPGRLDFQIEQAFTAAVAVLLEGDTGVLRYSNRRRLLDLAGRLGIVPFEANLLIERARFRATQRPGWAPPTDKPVRRRKLIRWLITVAVALLVDAAILISLLLL